MSGPGPRTTVVLAHGWKIGEETHREVELRRPTAGDLIDASAAAERVVATPAGYQLVQSPTLAGIEVLLRQIVRIGSLEDIQVTTGMLRGLDGEDLDTLQNAGDALLGAGLGATDARGRGAAAPA